MAKVINLKTKDDITSVVERLWETAEEEVFLVAAKDSAVLKNIIAMKLLKREAERLNKEVILITKDSVAREMAKRVGIASRVALPKNKKLEEDEEVFHDISQGKYESMLEDEVKAKRESVSGPRQFSDIRPNKAVVERHSIEIEEKDEKISLPVKREADNSSELDELINERALGDSFVEEEERGGSEENDQKEEKIKNFFDRPEDGEETKEGENEEEFPIHGLAKGERSGREKKPFFGHLLPFNLKKLGELLKIEKVRPEKPSRKPIVPFFSGKFLGMFAGAALVVALLALYFILPKAEISIQPKTEAVNQDLAVTADKGVGKIDFMQNKIPAQFVKLDKRQSQEFSATGQRQVNDKAKGIITIYNEFSSGAQALVEKTRFASVDGKIFRLIKSITVPGAKIQEGKIVASSIDAEVEADQPGGDYNIPAGRFTIPGFQGTPKYVAFYAQSKSAMSGGASGLMKIVTQDDYDKAKSEIWQKLQPSLDSDFKNQLPAGLKIIDGAMNEEISSVESDAAVGSPAEKFTLTVKGTATAVLFDEKDILEIIKKKLAGKLGGDKDLLLPAEQIGYKFSSVDFSRGQMVMRVKAAGNLVWKINSENLKREIVGQNEKAIRDIFSKHSEVSGARVVFWPFWVKSTPSNLDKVIIIVK
ncbi:MAG: hypothetical protein PHT44_02600 [Candidatus Portnoybacteria bacterium]|nr:hypothetical protein [Candidatus Portnoybacteria bacterium]MDD4982431.1 hypothetical protein [Candidatus Portnoybacteria bacterium]